MTVPFSFGLIYEGEVFLREAGRGVPSYWALQAESPSVCIFQIDQETPPGFFVDPVGCRAGTESLGSRSFWWVGFLFFFFFFL